MDQPLPEGECWFDGTIEVVFNKRHKVGRVLISPDGIDLYDNRPPIIRHDGRVVWIDISGRRIQKMTLLPVDQSMLDRIWDGPYSPGLFVKGVVAQSAPLILWYGAIDVTFTLLDIFPQSVAYATNSYAVGKVARLIFNLVSIFFLLRALKQIYKDKELAVPTIFVTWIICIMFIQFLIYGL